MIVFLFLKCLFLYGIIDLIFKNIPVRNPWGGGSNRLQASQFIKKLMTDNTRIMKTAATASIWHQIGDLRFEQKNQSVIADYPKTLIIAQSPEQVTAPRL